MTYKVTVGGKIKGEELDLGQVARLVKKIKASKEARRWGINIHKGGYLWKHIRPARDVEKER